MKERVFIVGLKTLANASSYDMSMEELRALAESAGGQVIARVDQQAEPSPRTYIGSGKVEEIAEMAQAMEIDSIIFNDELSGSQMKNLEKIIKRKVIDRTRLILDIFASRARTKEAVLQVSLAQAEYMLPRLEGYGSDLSRTGGGIGTRGPGEQQLETDRRHVRREISRIKDRLKVQEKNRATTSKRRRDSDLPIVSLLGYTNAGKSTIMNRIMDFTNREEDSKVYADDRLFATLDVSNRRVDYQDISFILADTVGLIEDLPIKLIEAFKTTLEEISYSDLILIVIDASVDNISRQVSSIRGIIEEIGLGDIDMLIVYNKMDLCQGPDQVHGHDLPGPAIYISALADEGIEELLEAIEAWMKKDLVRANLKIPYSQASLYSSLLDKYPALVNQAQEDGMLLVMDISQEDYEELAEYEVD